MPDYLRDNEFIVGSYRPQQSPWNSVKSLFGLHNETGNIWTHLLGVCWVCVLGGGSPPADTVDLTAAWVYCLAHRSYLTNPHKTNPTGFFLFVVLACWFTSHPPAPLALTADHLEHLWGNVQDRFSHLRVSEGVHALSDRMHHLGGDLIHGMHLDAVAHGLQEGLHGLQEGIQHRVTWGAGLGGGGVQDSSSRSRDSSSSRTCLLPFSISRIHPTLSPPTWQAADLVHSAEHLQSSISGRYHRVSAALNEQLQQQLSSTVQWPMPRWPVYVYFAGACVCLLTSCVCHLLGCCQRHISQIVWRFDYAGIAVLIVASFYPAVYYAFLCQPFWRNFYLVTTTIAGGGLQKGARAESSPLELLALLGSHSSST